MRNFLKCLLASTGLTLAWSAAAPAQTQEHEIQQTSYFSRKKGNDYCPVPCPPACQPVRPPEVTAPLPAPTPAPTPTPAPEEPTISPEQFAATGGGETFAAASSAVGYVDPALPVTRFRLRYDAAYDNNRPDRAEYFYSSAAAGTSSIDYQDLRPYLEYAIGNRFSAFVETPVRWLNPAQSPNTAGYADMIAGAKAALVLRPEQVLTFQFKTYIPTGSASQGLGTDHWSVEPGLLYFRQLTERLALESEFKWWVPIGGTNFAGNVTQYGAGLGYRILDTGSFRVIPVMEFVGWTVINGQESVFPANIAINAGGDTIINGKWGVRTGFGELLEGSQLSRFDIYAGYGRALTGDVWYKDLFRLEARLNF